MSSSSVDLVRVYVGSAGTNYGGDDTAEMTINAGSLNVTSRIDLGDYTSADPYHTGILNMNGGSLTTPLLTVGRIRSTGIINMTGGTITATTFTVSEHASVTWGAYVNLDGGTITCDTFTIRGPATLLDITEGTLVINASIKSTIDGYVTAGLIKAYGGLSTVVVDDTSQPGKTLVTATPYYKAFNPVPADTELIAALDVDDVLLSWSGGFGATQHEVFFSTVEADVINETVSSVVIVDDGPAVRDRHRSSHFDWRAEIHLGEWMSCTTSDTRTPVEGARVRARFLLNGGTGSPVFAGGFSGIGRGRKPHGGWGQSAEWLPGPVGSKPWSAAKPRAALFSDSAVHGGASTRGEGFGPTIGRVNLGGGEGQESIGSAVRLTAHNRVRTLSRSKALKSQALACRRRLQATFREPDAPLWLLCVDPPSAVFGRSPVPRLVSASRRSG
jgi:hypothetical protein